MNNREENYKRGHLTTVNRFLTDFPQNIPKIYLQSFYHENQ